MSVNNNETIKGDICSMNKVEEEEDLNSIIYGTEEEENDFKVVDPFIQKLKAELKKAIGAQGAMAEFKEELLDSSLLMSNLENTVDISQLMEKFRHDLPTIAY